MTVPACAALALEQLGTVMMAADIEGLSRVLAERKAVLGNFEGAPDNRA